MPTSWQIFDSRLKRWSQLLWVIIILNNFWQAIIFFIWNLTPKDILISYYLAIGICIEQIHLSSLKSETWLGDCGWKLLSLFSKIFNIWITEWTFWYMRWVKSICTHTLFIYIMKFERFLTLNLDNRWSFRSFINWWIWFIFFSILRWKILWMTEIDHRSTLRSISRYIFNRFFWVRRWLIRLHQ